MKHKPGSLEESAQRVLLGENSDNPRDRAKSAISFILDQIDDLTEKESDVDILIAYQQVIDLLRSNRPLEAKTISAIQSEDENPQYYPV